MRLTVAICTWNRADLLKRTLEQMTCLRVPADAAWEVLVVNNNCTDATDDVVRSFSRRLPVRQVFEAAPGLSIARNTAVRVATGDYILWTDDDVLVDSEWLRAYYDAFLQWPDAAMFGGPIEPLFAAQPPEWLLRTLDRFGPALSVLDLGPEPMPLARWEKPFGANVAFRADALAKFPFDPSLGVSSLRGMSSLAGEESAVMNAMLAAGLEGWWVPRARVKHYIAPERMTTAYLRRKSINWGKYVSRARLAEDAPRRPTRRHLLRRALQAELRYRFHLVFSEPEIWARQLSESGQCWGEFVGTVAQWRECPSASLKSAR
ncbi:MAG: glycosyltransferase family 2 protein [Actinomycetota bacterium]|nr:glycosyltransferase family 2 protein [Actinomycetota bacterium]